MELIEVTISSPSKVEKELDSYNLYLNNHENNSLFNTLDTIFL